MANYHIAEALKVGVHGYQARCDCGWIGPIRTLWWAASDDAEAHDETENDSDEV